MDIEEAKERLQQMVDAKPETAEQWAAICLLEQQIVDAEQNKAEAAYERQCKLFYGGDFSSLQLQQIEARAFK